MERQAKFATCEQRAAPRFTAEEEKTVIAHRRLTSRSPTGILTDNLAGPEPLASSATAAEALATPCLGLGALLRARREHGSEAWSGGAGCGSAKATWWWCGGAGRRRWSAAGHASISRWMWEEEEARRRGTGTGRETRGWRRAHEPYHFLALFCPPFRRVGFCEDFAPSAYCGFGMPPFEFRAGFFVISEHR